MITSLITWRCNSARDTSFPPRPERSHWPLAANWTHSNSGSLLHTEPQSAMLKSCVKTQLCLLNCPHQPRPPQQHTARGRRSTRNDILTGGGRILQIPVFSAMGRILLMYAKGSANSSQLGSKTGHSWGGMNSFSCGWVIVASSVGVQRKIYVYV